MKKMKAQAVRSSLTYIIYYAFLHKGHRSARHAAEEEQDTSCLSKKYGTCQPGSGQCTCI